MIGQLWRRISSGGNILCYHSITSPELPSNAVVNVSIERFAKDMSVLASCAEMVPLRTLVERHRAGRSCSGLVAITFDDAYASLLPLVLPHIRERSIPLTVFVACDAVAPGRAFWWDRLDDLHARVRPDRWRAFEAALGLPDAYRQGQPVDLGPLRPLRQWILATFAGRWNDQLETPLAELESETGFRTQHRCMNLEELDRFAASSLVELGVHTWSHPVLPLLAEDEIRGEIRSCLAWLRERYDRVLPVLAFPFGLFDARSAAVAEEEGMLASLSLSDRGLRYGRVGNVLPRIAGTRDIRTWKLRLRLSGYVDRIVQWRRGTAGDYPALPSPTT